MSTLISYSKIKINRLTHIVAGLFFVLEPWWFRRVARRVQSLKVIRYGGLFKAVIGAGLIMLALFVY